MFLAKSNCDCLYIEQRERSGYGFIEWERSWIGQVRQFSYLGANHRVRSRRCCLFCRFFRFSLALKTVAICAVLLVGYSQLNAIPVQASKQVATIRHIAVTGSDHDLDVEITATVPVTARTQTVTDPDRLIVDVPESLPSAGLHKVLVNRGKLIDIRVGLLSANPRITRVVLDLTSPTQYRVLPMGNTIVVKLSGESGPGPAPVAATTTPPAETRPAQTTSVVAIPPPARSPVPNRARWILPILVTAAVLAMLVIAVVSHIQNKRASRGL
jgi:hypothetical protein